MLCRCSGDKQIRGSGRRTDSTRDKRNEQIRRSEERKGFLSPYLPAAAGEGQSKPRMGGGCDDEKGKMGGADEDKGEEEWMNLDGDLLRVGRRRGMRGKRTETLSVHFIPVPATGLALGLLGLGLNRGGLYRMPAAVNQFTVAGKSVRLSK